MKTNFIHDNFLLENKYAEELYHNYSKNQPIIDYHNHLSPQLIAEDKYFGGEQITTVGRKTYLFGLLVGLIIGCLILLQLVITDNLVRNQKKLVSLVSFQKFLGNVDKKRNPNSVQHLATAIRGAIDMNKTTSLRFFPVDSKLDNEALVSELSSVIGCQALLVSSLANITTTDLLRRRRRDLRRDRRDRSRARHQGDLELHPHEGDL